MHRDVVLRADHVRELGGFFGRHGIDAVNGIEGVVDLPTGEGRQLRDLRGVAGVVDGDAVEADEVAVHVVGMVVLVPAADDGIDPHAIDFVAVVSQVWVERIRHTEDGAVRFPRGKVHRVVVMVLMGREDDIRGLGVIPFIIRVDVNHDIRGGVDLQGRMSDQCQCAFHILPLFRRSARFSGKIHSDNEHSLPI